MTNFNQKLEKLLKKDTRFLDQDGDLIKSEVVDKAWKVDKGLIELLLEDKEVKAKFFSEIKGHWIFNIAFFVDFVQDKNFLNDSYTKFKNKIGLTVDGKFLNQRGEVTLVWPYRDCVLEGGMSDEETERDEIFFNEILAQDEIDRLLDPKVLTNGKRFGKGGEKKFDGFTRDENGVLKDNLVIKGNNLIALHSLKKELAGKVKLIYIDPPYNSGGNGDTFAYNNRFKHSSWLTFMKNRLEVAKQLLRADGALICAIDDNEQPYLGVLLDEIFQDYEKHCITIVHNPRGVQGTNFSYTHEYAFFIIPKGLKTVGNRMIEDEDVSWRNLRDNGGESLRSDAKNCFYPIIVKNGEVVDFGDVVSDNVNPSQTEEKGGKFYVYPIDKQGVERKWRYARQSVEKIKHLLRVKEPKNGDGYEIEIGKDFGMYRTVWIDKKYDANEYGTKLVKSLVPDCKFSFPKSLYNVYDCLHAIVSDDPNAVVLDYHAGSGTTAHAVLELNKEDGGNRKFILVEQMDYIETVTVPRVQKVIALNAEEGHDLFQKQKGDESFVYFELKTYNQEFINRIQEAKTTKNLEKIWEEMKAKSFLNWNIDFRNADLAFEEWKALDFKKQQHALIQLLNKNQLYVNLSEAEDENMKCSDEEKKLSAEFYSNN